MAAPMTSQQRLLTLGNELLSMIVTQLDPPAAVCLALSCKHLKHVVEQVCGVDIGSIIPKTAYNAHNIPKMLQTYIATKEEQRLFDSTWRRAHQFSDRYLDDPIDLTVLFSLERIGLLNLLGYGSSVPSLCLGQYHQHSVSESENCFYSNSSDQADDEYETVTSDESEEMEAIGAMHYDDNGNVNQGGDEDDYGDDESDLEDSEDGADDGPDPNESGLDEEDSVIINSDSERSADEDEDDGPSDDDDDSDPDSEDSDDESRDYEQPYIEKLSNELLAKVIPFLDPPSAVCFALTCKHMMVVVTTVCATRLNGICPKHNVSEPPAVLQKYEQCERGEQIWNIFRAVVMTRLEFLPRESWWFWQQHELTDEYTGLMIALRKSKYGPPFTERSCLHRGHVKTRWAKLLGSARPVNSCLICFFLDDKFSSQYATEIDFDPTDTILINGSP